MKDSEVSTVSVNHCIRDSELEELERLVREADPGEWRVVAGRVEGRSGAPLERAEASFRLMVRAVSSIPRLVRGIRALEDALRSARLSEHLARRELAEERERHAADMERASKASTGPDTDIDALVEAIELGEFSPRAGSIGTRQHRRQWLARWLRAWSSGVSVQEHPLWRIDLESARYRRTEEDRFRAEQDSVDETARAEVRALLEELRLKKREREQIAERVRLRVGG